MRALFLADAHLRRPTDLNYQALLSFLAEEAGRTDMLVLLGDIFEFWAGDRRHLHASYRPLLAQLDQLHRSGTQLVYVEGNHDFDMGVHFTQRLGCRVLPDGGTLQLDGHRIYMAHGDLANPDDSSYRFLRRLLRHAITRWLIRHLPIGLVFAAATHTSQQSQTLHKEKSRRWPARDILVPFAKSILAEGHSTVITGHYHEPFREQLDNGELIALGDWIDQYSYLVYTDGRFELCQYSFV
jgi:UDP-2,3-diacylglucosamine hydrolase